MGAEISGALISFAISELISNVSGREGSMGYMKRRPASPKKGAVENASGAKAGLNAQEIVTLSSVLGRAQLSRALRGGSQFNGARDMYETLGYKRNPTFDDFLEKYRRQDLAGKVVDLPPQDTWRKPPVIQDGAEDSSLDAPISPFLQGIKFLVDQRRLWHYLMRVDKLAGIGRYGVLVIGTAGANSLSEPLAANSLSSPQDVIYLSVFSEKSATVQTLDRQPESQRFGLPELYTLALGEGLGTANAHWSRTIHVADDLLEDDIYGMPRLERVLNRLDDVLKLVGGGSEAAWKNMDRGLHADVRDGFDLDESQEEALSDEIDEYIHGLRRFIRTQGVDLDLLGSDMVDPTGMFQALIALIAAASDIPQRILLGSERGELASGQDEANWAGSVASRQTQFAEPVILRPFIDRLISAGALPEPSSGTYKVSWPSLFELNDIEKAEIAERYANAIQKVAPAGSPELVVDPDEFREYFIERLPARDLEAEVMDEEDAESEDLSQ